jgi:hypothetical protein
MRAGGVWVKVGTIAEETTTFGGSASAGMSAGVDGGAVMALQRRSASHAAVGIVV